MVSKLKLWQLIVFRLIIFINNYLFLYYILTNKTINRHSFKRSNAFQNQSFFAYHFHYETISNFRTNRQPPIPVLNDRFGKYEIENSLASKTASTRTYFRYVNFFTIAALTIQLTCNVQIFIYTRRFPKSKAWERFFFRKWKGNE